MSQPLRIATRNAGKLREFRQVLEPLGFDVRGIEDLAHVAMEETGSTFEENACIKARAIAQATGAWTLADDSGLEVDALGGAPGVHTARYAGVDGPEADAANRTKLLSALQEQSDRERAARFVCVLALCTDASQAPLIFRGTLDGQIAPAERGEGGFGYDSVFLVPSRHSTLAELEPAIKNRLSHRGQALARLLAHLNATR